MKRLFLICPTDYLETQLNAIYGKDNYYYTSLGNSIELNKMHLGQIKKLIHKKQILEIIFILKENNNIISHSIKGNNLNDIKGMAKLSKEIKQYKPFVSHFTQEFIEQKLYISYLLNKKTLFLTEYLRPDFPEVEIKAMIYENTNNRLINVIHPLLSNEKMCPN